MNSVETRYSREEEEREWEDNPVRVSIDAFNLIDLNPDCSTLPVGLGSLQ